MERLSWAIAAADLIRQDGCAVLVTICSVEGSAPRAAGTKMLIGRTMAAGTIGGGNLEFRAIEQGRKLLDRPDLPHLMQDYPLGPLLQQCCGGHVRLLLERLAASDLSWLEDITGHDTHAEAAFLETRLNGGAPRKLLRPASTSVLSTGDQATVFLGTGGKPVAGARPAKTSCAALLEHIPAALPTVILYGAGHVGQAIAHVLSITDFPVRWFDSRDDYAGRYGDLTAERLSDLSDTLATSPSSAIHLVLTHDHDLDYEIVRAVLHRGDFTFCGLIGSKTKRARFLRRLREDGVSEAAVSRLTCPIGIPELAGKTPATIAISTVSQLMQLDGVKQSAPVTARRSMHMNKRQKNPEPAHE